MPGLADRRQGTRLGKAPAEADPAVIGTDQADRAPAAARVETSRAQQPQIAAPRTELDRTPTDRPPVQREAAAARTPAAQRPQADRHAATQAPENRPAPQMVRPAPSKRFEPENALEDGVDGLTAYLPESLKQKIRVYQATMAASYDARRYETGRVVVDAFNALSEPTAAGMNLDRILELARGAEDVSRAGLDRRKPHPGQLVAYHRPPLGKRLRPWQFQAGPELVDLLDTISTQTGATQSAVVRVVLAEFMRLREEDEG